jgi:hypothetical protein
MDKAEFVAAGLAARECVLVFGAPEGWSDLLVGIAERGQDARSALRDGRLCLFGAQMLAGASNDAGFERALIAILDRARGRFPAVRVLSEGGERRWTELRRREDFTLLCA